MGGFVSGFGQGVQNTRNMQEDIARRRQESELFKLKSKQIKLETDMTEKQLAAQAALPGQLFQPPQQKQTIVQGPGAPQPVADPGLMASFTPAELAQGRGIEEGPQPTGMMDIPGTGGPMAGMSPELQGIFQNIFMATGGDMGKTMSTLQILAPSAFPQKPFMQKLGEGETFQEINPATGQSRVLAQGNPKYHAPVNLGPDHTAFDPVSGQPLFTAPSAPEKPGKLKDDIMEIGGVAYQVATGADGKKVLTPMEGLQPGQDGMKPVSDENRLALAEYGKPFTSLDPTQQKAVNDKIKQDRVDVSAATGVESAKTSLAKQKQELLSAEEANKLRVPYGTTREEATGMMALTGPQLESIAAFDSAITIVDDITKYSARVNTNKPGIMGRLGQAGKLWGAYTQSDPEAALMMSKVGELSLLARAMGEKGALATEDVARAAALVPGVTDTVDVAQMKIRDLTKLVNSKRAAYIQQLGPGRMDFHQPAAQPKAAGAAKSTAPQASASADGIPNPPAHIPPEHHQAWRDAYAEMRQRAGGQAR